MKLFEARAVLVEEEAARAVVLEEGTSRSVAKGPAREDESTALCINCCTCNRLGLVQIQHSPKRLLLGHKNDGAPLFWPRGGWLSSGSG